MRALRRLVTALTLSLILGVVVVAAALVIRISAPAPIAGPTSIGAERLSAPPGESIVASGFGPGGLTLVTRDAAGVERLRVYESATGALIRSIEIVRAPD